MIHIFNRKELAITWSMEEMVHVCGILDANGIEYSVKTNRTLASSPARDGRAGSTPGINQNSVILHSIYVRRDDLEYAANLIKNQNR